MKHRTTRSVAALAVGLSLLLAGCSSDKDTPDAKESSPSASASGEPAPTAADKKTIESVKVDGKVGAEPKVTFDSPLTVSTVVSEVDTKGTGDTIKDGQQVTMNYVTFNGKDGSKVGSSTWETKSPQTFAMGAAGYEVLNTALDGQKVGARVVVGTPQETDTLVHVVEVVGVKTVPARAKGEAVKPADGLPTVALDDAGKPTITIPKDYKAPTELVAQTLIKGDGPALKADQQVTVNYTGWKLDGEQFDSSWDKGAPLTIGLGQVVKGWTEGLTGQTVGSQVLLVIPPALGYGAEKSDENPLAGQTLVFVVDILAAE